MRSHSRRRLSTALAITTLGLAVPALAQIPAQKQVQSLKTEAGAVAVEQLASGLNHPWGMSFLPDGRLLLTERSGQLRILGLDGELSAPLAGVPEVFARGQGGLMDVALDPNFEENRRLYLAFAKPGPDGTAATALGRGRLTEDGVENFEEIFQMEPWVSGPNHFGTRIVFDDAGHLFLALGERFKFDPAQELDNHLGKVVRIHPDGSVPSDNPFVGKEGAQPEIWSYGHRNIEAAAIDPATGKLWIVEMGPMGGDELNQPEPGRNYGWPVVSWGMHYDGTDIPDPPTRPEFADAVKQFTPVISPSGMQFYTGDAFPAWRGSALIGGLSGHQVARLKLQDGKVVEEERIPLPARIRDVEQGPDGNIYLLTSPERRAGNEGFVWRLRPMSE